VLLSKEICIFNLQNQSEERIGCFKLQLVFDGTRRPNRIAKPHSCTMAGLGAVNENVYMVHIPRFHSCQMKMKALSTG
jgi:hypothetical protein